MYYISITYYIYICIYIYMHYKVDPWTMNI